MRKTFQQCDIFFACQVVNTDLVGAIFELKTSQNAAKLTPIIPLTCEWRTLINHIARKLKLTRFKQPTWSRVSTTKIFFYIRLYNTYHVLAENFRWTPDKGAFRIRSPVPRGNARMGSFRFFLLTTKLFWNLTQIHKQIKIPSIFCSKKNYDKISR